jgi:aryl-alcohol dehydrogenase-like predicted oxidoreductase
MRAIADTHGASVAQVAIAWLLSRQAVTSVLIGATKSHQLADNLKAADVTLMAEQIADLDAATAPAPVPVYPNWFIDRLTDTQLADALAGRKAKS